MAQTTTKFKKNITGKEFVRGSLWMYLAAAVAFSFGLGTTAVVARLLDKELFGIFSVCVAIASLLAAFSDLGLNSAVRYYSSVFSAKQQQNKLSAYLSVLLKWKIYIVIFLALFMYIFANSLANIFHSPQAASYFEIATFYLVFLGFYGFLQTALGGLRLFKESSLVLILFNILKFVLAPGLIFYGFGISGALLGFVIATGVATLALVFVLRKLITFKPEKIDLKRAASYSFYAGVGGLASAILIWTDSIMIGLLMAPVFVGFYKIAITLSLAVTALISSGIPDVLFPSLTTLETMGDKKRLQKYFNESVRYGAFLSLPAVAGLILISSPLITLLFGAQYLPAIPVLMILSIFPLAALMNGIIISTFKALNKPEVMAKIFIIMLILNVLLNIVLIPMWGITGAATATSTTWMLGIILSAALLKKNLKIKFEFEHLIKPLIGSAVMFIILYPFIDFANTIAMGLLYVASGVVIYAIVMMLLGFPIKDFVLKILGAFKK